MSVFYKTFRSILFRASVFIGLLCFSTPDAHAQFFVVDLDPATGGIQTTFTTSISAGTFPVDVYMVSPGPFHTESGIISL